MAGETVSQVLRVGIAALRAAGIPGPVRDARLLMSAALGEATGRLSLREPEQLGEAAGARFRTMVAARSRRQPVAQILGERDFWGRLFRVTPDVLDPRPETETLIAAALAGAEPRAILDLGTGSGAILVTLLAEWPGARGTGIDTSVAALAIARTNADRHGTGPRAAFIRADWDEGITDRFDLVVCNPPYIAEAALAGLDPDVRDWEPKAALSPGQTGLEAYCRIAPALTGLLAPGGRALFEIGADQGVSVPQIFAAAGLIVDAVLPDLDGRDRVVSLRMGEDGNG